MLKRSAALLALSLFGLSLAGCATARKQNTGMEIQGLRNQVSLLETQIQAKDEEINNLKEALNKASVEKETAGNKNFAKRGVASIPKSRPNAKHIQQALVNAGYNPGPVDGHKGKQTKDAIEAFQKANNLQVDGKVGKKTWSLLREYLIKKIK